MLMPGCGEMHLSQVGESHGPATAGKARRRRHEACNSIRQCRLAISRKSHWACCSHPDCSRVDSSCDESSWHGMVCTPAAPGVQVHLRFRAWRCSRCRYRRSSSCSSSSSSSSGGVLASRSLSRTICCSSSVLGLALLAAGCWGLLGLVLQLQAAQDAVSPPSPCSGQMQGEVPCIWSLVDSLYTCISGCVETSAVWWHTAVVSCA